MFFNFVEITSHTMKAKLFISLLCLVLCVTSEAKHITWLSPTETYFVTTVPNAVMYVNTIYQHNDDNSDKRIVVDYSNRPSKIIKKPKSFLVKGYANSKKQLGYDTYVVENKGKLFFIPSQFVENTQPLEEENTRLTDTYKQLILDYKDIQNELDSLTEYYLNDCETHYQYYSKLETKLNTQLDSVTFAAQDEYAALQQKQYDDWYKSLPASTKKAADRIDITEAKMSSPNFLGGCDYTFKYTNKSKKTIKYLKWWGDTYNAVDDRVLCEIRGSSNVIGNDTGPISPNGLGGGLWEAIVYNNSAKYVKFYKIDIIYTDGSTYTIAAADVKRMLTSPRMDDNAKAFRNKYGYSSEYVTKAKESFKKKMKDCETQVKVWRERVNYLKSGKFEYPLRYSGSDYNSNFEKLSGVFNKKEDIYTQLTDFQTNNFVIK